MNRQFKKYFFILGFCLVFSLGFAQTKSTTIQTIDGTRYYIHKIEKGQSLYGISKLYNVSVDAILAVNPDLKAGAKAGQEIKVPFNAVPAVTHTVAPNSNTRTPASSTVQPIDTSLYYIHKVAKKETFYSISKKYNITETELKILNPSLLSQGLQEGQVIVVGEKQRSEGSAPNNTTQDSSLLNVIHKPRKTNYNIALILPFKLDESLNLDLNSLVKTNSNFPVVPGLAVDFYLGFKKATDSLATKDFSVNIDLYDIDDKDTVNLMQMVNSDRFKQTDFVFGPLHVNGFKPIAQKAKDNGIPIVSPVTQMNKILYNNIYVSKTNPSQFTLLESLADYCIDSLVQGNTNIILIAPPGKDVKEEGYVKAFKKYYNDRQKALGKLPKDTVTVVKGLAGVKAAYRPDVKNVIVTLSNNQVFIADFTTQLAIFAGKKDITLCGWQSLSSIDNIDQEYLNQLNYTFPSQYNITNAGSYLPVAESYRQEQNASPGEYYFMGFDVAYFYLKNLKETGPDFVFKLDQFPAETNYMRFKFTRPDNTTGFDNRGVYIFRYNNYQLQKTGWK